MIRSLEWIYLARTGQKPQPFSRKDVPMGRLYKSKRSARFVATFRLNVVPPLSLWPKKFPPRPDRHEMRQFKWREK